MARQRHRGAPRTRDAETKPTPVTPIGQLIKEELQAQERTVAWFARKLHLDRSNIYRLFQKNSIDTDLLGRISVILGRDFFEILSEEIKERNNRQGV